MIPVITNIGPSYDFSAIGYLKSSPDGSKIAAANYISGLILFDIFDFNNAYRIC